MNTRYSSLITRHSLLFLFCFLFIYIPLATGATVSEVEIHGLSFIEKEELLDLLCFKPGNPIDAMTVRQGIKRAFLKGAFDDISIETTDKETTRVIINVKERDFIKKVYVEGDYDLPRKFINKTFLLKEGQTIRYEMIEDAIQQLRNQIENRGYPHTSINVKIERTKALCRVNLRLQIQTGEPERIRKIIISGGPEEIKKRIRLSEGDIYDQVELEKNLQKIKTQYKKDGYVKTNIGPYTFSDGTLNIFFHPGEHLMISVEGNSVIPKKDLKKQMPLFETTDFTSNFSDQ